MAPTTEGQARRLMARLDALAAFTDDPPKLTRLCLSESHRRAAEQFIAWAKESGLSARIDPVGNVRARYEGRRLDAPALMIGSHIDTVRGGAAFVGALMRSPRSRHRRRSGRG
jgi:allantoate deiminase